MSGGAAKRSLRGVRWLAGLTGASLLFGVLAAGGLAWRLTRGPLGITGPARLLAARAAPGLAFDRMTLALIGGDLRLAVAGLRIGEDGPRVAHAAAAFGTVALLHGALRPREVSAEGLRLAATRAADGRFVVRGLPDASPSGAAPDPAMLEALTHVALRDATVTVTDAASRQAGQMVDLAVELRRDKLGVIMGHAQAALTAGDVHSLVTLDATRPPNAGLTRLHVTAAAVNPATVARLAPALAPLAALDAMAALTADLELTPALDLRHATVHAQTGPGRAFLPAKDGGTSPGAFAATVLDADGDAQALRLTGLRVVLAPPSGAPPSTIVVTGDAVRAPDRALAHLHVTLDRAQMADLSALWPVGVGGGARPWLVENVAAGAVHDGAFDLTLEVPAALDDVALTAAGGVMQADEVSVFWLRPVPPIEHAHVLLTLVDPDSLTLLATGGREGALLATQASMRIWGMATKDQFGQIESDITAPIADVFALLAHPKLKLLSEHPLPLANPTGRSATHLTVKLPLEEKVDFDVIGIHATTQLTDVRVPSIGAGQALDRGAFGADITQDGLALKGTARLGGVESALTVDMDFRNGPPNQVVQHVTVAARGDDRALAATGLDTIGLLAGTVSAKLDYTEQRDGNAVVQGSADLREATLSTPLGWSKLAGLAATIEARAALDHGRLAGFDTLRAEGPGLSVRGRSEMVDGWPSVLHIEQCVIGRTSLTGTVSFPTRASEPLRVVLSGPRLDLSGPLSRKTTAEPATPDAVAAGRPYRIDLRFDRVLLNETNESIGPASLSASGDERRIAQAHFVSAGPEAVDARIEPHGMTRRVSATIGDVGLLLRGVGSGFALDQGALTIDATFDDRRAGSPLAGTASLGRFGVHGAAVFGKLLQGMTLYGLVDALRGPGLVFDQLTSPFTLVGPVLELREARAYSSSLGVTARGRVDFGHATIDLKGTLVPAYFFNTLPGRVPLIGHLFSPEEGGGLFAATYSLRGKLADPIVGFNPLATLTPGALRGLFGLFE